MAPDTTTVTTPSAAVVDRFLDRVAAGRGAELAEVFTGDGVLDATVPDWRFTVRGAAAVATELGRWYTHPGRFEELDRSPLPNGELVRYLFTWEENGVPHAAHHCHVLHAGPDGRIVRDQVWCGGRWDAALLAEMGTMDDAG